MWHWVHTVKYEVSFFWRSTSRIICVLRVCFDATSRSPRVLPVQLQFGPQNELQKELKRSLGPRKWQSGFQDPLARERVVDFGTQMGPKGSRFEAQNRTKNRVYFWSWKSPRDLKNQWNPLERLLFSVFRIFLSEGFFLIDFRGPEGPLGELWGVNVDYFFSSWIQHDLGFDFEPQNGSLLSPRDHKMVYPSLGNRGPGTLFGRFGFQC